MFPKGLRNIPDAPNQLYVRGDIDSSYNNKRLSVVGSRKVSPYGKGVSFELVKEIAEQGATIISGLAIGVDSLAHHAALKAGAPTIAVLPCGVDMVYPASNRSLAERILKSGGALVSEYPDGTPPLQHHFVARNRIVAGLGEALLVTEAAKKSGTLHTAGFALDQGKPIFAVPGNITSQLSMGTNKLIKTGAHPVTESCDILQTMGLLGKDNKKSIIAANAEEAALISLLRQGISEISDLERLSELGPALFNQTMSMLEINGKIRPLGAGHWSLAN